MPRYQHGFTLIELMVTLAVILILLIVGAPSLQTTIYANRLTGAANEYIAALQTARTEAIRYNRRTVVCLSTNANTATPTCAADNAINATGWLVFTDINRNGDYAITDCVSGVCDRLLRVATTNPSVVIKGSSNLSGKVKVIFRSDGLARTSTGAVLNGTVDMCMGTTRPRENGRHVSIRGGSVAISRFTDQTCVEPGNAT